MVNRQPFTFTIFFLKSDPDNGTQKMDKCPFPLLKQWLKTKSPSSRSNHQTQALREAATVAASGLPFGVLGFREVQGLCVELFLQGHRDWLVHKQPGGWVAGATTVHSQVWVVLGDPKSGSAQQQPVLRPLASSPTRSRASGSSNRTCPYGLA